MLVPDEERVLPSLYFIFLPKKVLVIPEGTVWQPWARYLDKNRVGSGRDRDRNGHPDFLTNQDRDREGKPEFSSIFLGFF